MSKPKKSVKLCVEFEGLKLVYVAKKDLVVGKLLKKLELSFEENFSLDAVPSFKKLTDKGYLVSLFEVVGDVFEDNSEIQVHSDSPRQSLNIFSAALNEKSNKGLKKDSSKEPDFRREKEAKTETNPDKPNEKHKPTEKDTKNTGKKEEAKATELKREASKSEAKTDSAKKNKRPEVKEPIIKTMKIDEEKKVQNDSSKKDILKTSSESDSDSDIFTKDDRKTSKSSTFRS